MRCAGDSSARIEPVMPGRLIDAGAPGSGRLRRRADVASAGLDACRFVRRSLRSARHRRTHRPERASNEVPGCGTRKAPDPASRLRPAASARIRVPARRARIRLRASPRSATRVRLLQAAVATTKGRRCSVLRRHPDRRQPRADHRPIDKRPPARANLDIWGPTFGVSDPSGARQGARDQRKRRRTGLGDRGCHCRVLSWS